MDLELCESTLMVVPSFPIINAGSNFWHYFDQKYTWAENS